MGVVVTPARTQIDDCEDATDWSGGATNDSFNLEGTNCLGEKVTSTNGSPVAGSENLYTFPGANPDMTDEFIVIPMSITGRAATLAQGGFRILAVDGATDKGTWYVGGDDTTNERWTYFTVDPSTAPTYINGVLNSDIGIVSNGLTSSGTAGTCVCTAAHGLAVGERAVIKSPTDFEYAGNWEVLTVTTTTVTNDTFTFTLDQDADNDTAANDVEVRQGIDFTDVDKVGVQMAVVTKAVGNTENTFWDICWYGSGLAVTSTIDSVTITRSGSTVIVADTGHGLAVGDTVRIAGADQTEYNGDHVITVSNTDDYRYEIATTPTTPATGTITSKVHATWEHIADADATGFWGMCVKSNGTYILQGQFVLGSEGATGDLLFVDDNFVCIFRQNLFLPASKNNIVLARHLTGDLTEIEWSDGFIGGNETLWGYTASWANSGFDPTDITVTGMTFSNMNNFVCGDNATYTYTDCKWNKFDAVTWEASTVDGAVLNDANVDSVGQIWGPTTANVTNVESKNSRGDFHMALFGTSTVEETFDGMTFDASVATDIVMISGMADAASVTSIERTGSVATVTTGAAHGLATNDWATISGAVETDYNGFFKITVLTTTTFTYVVPGTPTTPATGTILWEETLIINQINGSNASTHLAFYGVIEFITSVTHTVTNLRTNDRVIWIRVSDGVELFNTLESSGSAAYPYNYVSDTDVYVQVLSGDNTRKNTVTEVTLGNTNASIPAVQAVDNVYLNP